MGFAWFYKYEESSASYFHFLLSNSKLEYSKPSISKISSLEKEIQSSVNEKYPEAMSLLSLRERRRIGFCPDPFILSNAQSLIKNNN